MDIDHDVYYFILDAENRDSAHCVFNGIDFHGGLDNEVSQRVSAAKYLVSSSGSRALADKLSVVHRNRFGNTLVLTGNYNGDLPCLLTTDLQMKWAYAGKVSIRTSDPEFDLETFPTKGIALCGGNWVGALRLGEEGFRLDACARDEIAFAVEESAFCPDWSEGLENPDSLIIFVKSRE
ncbi:hypothetical protein [Blastopirellula marina]|uniref:Uncharacterized protein n=1 Tax=Blastopirellula marina DSM 3645 TaxID=314230 RepID=A4A1R8_9BACT|nr:hypothetical protein [Blastopirellula marina]EAQ77277.1 hypothetical protein DSM3645_29366 [Blastopirellula marina DSM 3645]